MSRTKRALDALILHYNNELPNISSTMNAYKTYKNEQQLL